jgi:multidrug efflux pump
MQLSDVSIRRPVFASVLSLLLLVAGLAALSGLPVREYPAVDPPVISVGTVYRGASNEVVENRVTEILEQAVAGIEGIRQITSNSRNERSNISIEFDVGRDPDAAAADVRDRVSRTLGRLPDGVDTPVIARVDANAQAMMWISVYNPTISSLELSDYLRRNIVDRLSTVPGVANVTLGGERRYAMRIYLNRGAMAARGITAQDIEAAIRRQNVELPGGRLTSSQREMTVKTESRLANREEFGAIVVANRNSYQVRLREVARLEVGAEDDRFEFYADGKLAFGLGIVRQSTANTLTVADGVLQEIKALNGGRPFEGSVVERSAWQSLQYTLGYSPALTGAFPFVSLVPYTDRPVDESSFRPSSFPQGTELKVLFNEATFINASIRGVLITLAEGVGLVVLVILVFLRSWRSTLVATIAIPFSVIPTFMVLWAFGFSINVLTLLAIVLAIGIVVDDAIVEVENVHRRIEEGEEPVYASFLGAREIAFAVIATTITLMAVFIPMAFIPGQTGRLFREFAVTLAAAIGFSGLVARSLTPMLCSKLLVAEHGFIHRWTEPAFLGMNAVYRAMLKRALAAPLLVAFVAIGVALCAVRFGGLVKQEFVPTEDRSTIIIPIRGPEGTSLNYSRDRVREIERLVRPYEEQGLVQSMLSIVAPGFQRPAPVNEGLVILRLKPWSERTMTQQQLTQRLMGPVAGLPGARAFPSNPASLGQRGFGQPVQMILGGPDYQTLKAWRDQVIPRAQATGKFQNLDSDFQEAQPDVRVQIQRDRAADLGISVEVIGRTLELMFGEREVSTYIDRGSEYRVIVQAQTRDRASPTDLKNVFVRTQSGDLVPLSNVVSLTEIAGPQELRRFDRSRSITIQGSPAPGVALGEALATLENVVAEVLPPEVKIGYNGQSKEFKRSSSALFTTFAVALLVVFLVLAAQFESWIAPFVIMLTVPLAVTGGLGALYFNGMSLNIYSQIGLILLIGIMTKNGILIVEFTNQLKERGIPHDEAVLEASVMRLRPILMTSIATVMGAVPLALSYGAGAESRSAIGWVIVGGGTLATIMALFVVPAMYLVLGRYTAVRNAIGEKLDKMLAERPEGSGDGALAGHGHGKPAAARAGKPPEGPAPLSPGMHPAE